MRTFIFISVFVFTGFFVVAQHTGGYTVSGQGTGYTIIDLYDLTLKMNKDSNTKWFSASYDPETEGSPYLEEFWSKGTMILKSDTMIQGLDYRYNIYSDEMEMRMLKDTMALIHPEKVRTLNFNKRTFIYDAYEKNEIAGHDYFEVLADGKCRLLLQRKVAYVPKNPPATPMSPGNEHNRFILSEFIYFQREGSKATYVKCTRKNILAFLADHKAELDQYAKTEKIHFNDKTSLAKLILYYNSLN